MNLDEITYQDTYFLRSLRENERAFTALLNGSVDIADSLADSSGLWHNTCTGMTNHAVPGGYFHCPRHILQPDGSPIRRRSHTCGKSMRSHTSCLVPISSAWSGISRKPWLQASLTTIARASSPSIQC